jgi:hypothetical protein
MEVGHRLRHYTPQHSTYLGGGDTTPEQRVSDGP